MKKILLVCTGNTCRSAMAEALLDDEVDRSSLSLKVDSAGTFACEGQEATDHAKQVMEEMGLDIDRHRAKQINAELVDWADLILTMEGTQYEQIEVMYPQAESKTHTFKGYAEGVYGFAGDAYSVQDPYGEDVEEYRACAKQLQELCQKIVSNLEN